MNIYEIANKAGVSIATVSRVLNNSGSVSEKTRERIMQIIKEDHYQPNIFARGLVLDSMKVIGVICTDVSDIFIAKALNIVQSHLHERNYDTLLFCVGQNNETRLRHIRYLESKKVDAIILIGSAFSNSSDTGKLRKIAQSIPIIMINGFIDAKGIYSVYCDDCSAVKQVTEIACNSNERVVFMYDSMTQGTLRKIAGFKEALKTKNIPFCEDMLIEANSDIESSYNVIMKMIENDMCPGSIIASSDVLAAGSLKAIKEAHKNCSVVGFDNTLICQVTSPTLTSIDPRIEDMCSIAFEMLDNIFNNKSTKKTVVLKAQINWRESFK